MRSRLPSLVFKSQHVFWWLPTMALVIPNPNKDDIKCNPELFANILWDSLLYGLNCAWNRIISALDWCTSDSSSDKSCKLLAKSTAVCVFKTHCSNTVVIQDIVFDGHKHFFLYTALIRKLPLVRICLLQTQAKSAGKGNLKPLCQEHGRKQQQQVKEQQQQLTFHGQQILCLFYYPACAECGLFLN